MLIQGHIKTRLYDILRPITIRAQFRSFGSLCGKHFYILSRERYLANTVTIGPRILAPSPSFRYNTQMQRSFFRQTVESNLTWILNAI